MRDQEWVQAKRFIAHKVFIELASMRPLAEQTEQTEQAEQAVRNVLSLRYSGKE